MTRSGRVYTPQETAVFESQVAFILKAQMRLKKYETFKTPVFVAIRFYLPKPNKPKFSVPACKPDIDNLAKAIMDAANKILWTDDGLVIQLYVEKNYEPKPCSSGISIIVKDAFFRVFTLQPEITDISK